MEPRIRVLLVEDDEDDQVLTRALLARVRDVSYSLAWVRDVDVALREIGERPPDVVLSDFRLGGRSGMELLEELRDREDAPPVILLTGQGTRALDLAAEAAGAADYLTKGEITPELLERSIRYAIRQHALLAEIRTLSLTDELTGLHNRRGFLTLAGQQLQLAHRAGYGCVLFYADLDGIKEVNDALGHAAGDQALRDLAAALRRTFRASDVLARLGGDEFAVLSVEADARAVEGIQQRLRSNLGAREVPLEVSVGWAEYDPPAPADIDALLARADAAMYEEKRRRKGARRAPVNPGPVVPA